MSGDQSFFGKLPGWAKVLFVLVYPLSIPYGIYRMWRTQKFNRTARIIATSAGALFLVVAMAVGSTGGDAPLSETSPPTQSAIEESASEDGSQEDAAEEESAESAAAEKAAAEKAAAEKAAAEKAAAEKAAAEKAAAEKAAAEKAAAEKAAAEKAAAEKAAAEKAAAEKAAAEKAAAEKAAADQAAAAAAASAASAASSGGEVYITNTGAKYHRGGCSSLSESKIPISRADAEAQGYEPCKRCY